VRQHTLGPRGPNAPAHQGVPHSGTDTDRGHPGIRPGRLDRQVARAGGVDRQDRDDLGQPLLAGDRHQVAGTDTGGGKSGSGRGDALGQPAVRGNGAPRVQGRLLRHTAGDAGRRVVQQRAGIRERVDVQRFHGEGEGVPGEPRVLPRGGLGEAVQQPDVRVEHAAQVAVGKGVNDTVPGDSEHAILVPHDVVEQHLGGLRDAEDLRAKPARRSRGAVTGESYPTGEDDRVGRGAGAVAEPPQHINSGDRPVVQVLPEATVELRCVTSESVPRGRVDSRGTDQRGGGEVAHHQVDTLGLLRTLEEGGVQADLLAGAPPLEDHRERG